MLVHHPYDSFATSVQRFIEQAAADPNVLAIKQTLYRTSGDSPIVDALIDAAAAGKQVVALVEIKARFDEQANIPWARDAGEGGRARGLRAGRPQDPLQDVAGGAPGGQRRSAATATSAPATTTRRRRGSTRTSACSPPTRRSAPTSPTCSTCSPATPGRPRTGTCWSRRTASAAASSSGSSGDRARTARAATALVRIKMNSLVDEEVIDALYRASQAGVPVDLIVRGICALRPGVPGLSENIRVRSIVGRFLEHSRIFYFGAGRRRVLDRQRRHDAPQPRPPGRGAGAGDGPDASRAPGDAVRAQHSTRPPGAGSSPTAVAAVAAADPACPASATSRRDAAAAGGGADASDRAVTSRPTRDPTRVSPRAPCSGAARRTTASQVALVHRPRYDDWSLPKGKADPARRRRSPPPGRCGGDRLRGAASAVRSAHGPYNVPAGRRSCSTLGQATGGAFAPNAEVDELEWLPPGRRGRAAHLRVRPRRAGRVRRARGAVRGPRCSSGTRRPGTASAATATTRCARWTPRGAAGAALGRVPARCSGRTGCHRAVRSLPRRRSSRSPDARRHADRSTSRCSARTPTGTTRRRRPARLVELRARSPAYGRCAARAG